MPRLEHTLADTCVVVGLNQDVPFIEDNGNVKARRRQLKYGPYKQRVLGVLTTEVAYFPESQHIIEAEPFYDDSQVICPAAHTLKGDSRYNKETHGNLPFSNEVISSLPIFCYPSGGYIFKEKQEPVFSTLVLTDIDGRRTYAVCVTITQPIIATVRDDEELSNPNFYEGEETNRKIVYAPICICLVSYFPYFETLKSCLSSLLPQIEDGADDAWWPFMKLSSIVTTVPVPPAGPLCINFEVFGNDHILLPPDETQRRVIDLNLQLPLLIFDPATVVEIVTCLLTQQRLVFISSSYGQLTMVIETFLTYIDPIKWRLTYVPVLPNSLGDLMEAPGPFIMGVHSSLSSQVYKVRSQPEIPSIIVVNIDKGVIEYDDKTNLPSMPDVVAQSLLVRLRNVSQPTELKLLTQPTKFSYEEMIEEREIIHEKVEEEIKDAFLDMLVSLFDDIFNYLSFGEQFFNKKAYIDSRDEDEKEFFVDVLNSDAMERFIEERFEYQEGRDIFAVLGERIAIQRKLAPRRRSSSILQQLKERSYMVTNSKHDKIILTVPIQLDESLKNGQFYRNFRNCITQQLDQLNSSSIELKAVYLYLRGYMQIAYGDPINGLRDFHALFATSPHLYPKDYTSKVINTLKPVEIAHLQNEEFYKQEAATKRHMKKNLQKINNSLKISNSSLDKTEFSKRLKTLKISYLSELNDRLFNVVSNNQEVLHPKQFAEFYAVYLEVEKSLHNRDIARIQIDQDDYVLFVSPLVNSAHGNGRLILTTKKLLFLGDGGRECVFIMFLCDIKEITQYQKTSVIFWTGVAALRIVSKDSNIPPFFVCLKDETDVSLLFLNEMVTANKSALALSDQSMIETGKNNVVIGRVLLNMKYPLKIVQDLCAFVINRRDSIKELSEESKESLEMRLDPCIREVKRTTVMCIAYVPGNKQHHESASLWCGMGSGAIMVYETDTWNCVSELRYAQNRVSCLFLIGNHVWAGSFDSSIYVINKETRISEQQLQNHTDFISDIIQHAGGGNTSKVLVWSSSYNGQLICWNPKTRDCVKTVKLKNIKTLSKIFFVNSTNLWCVTSDKILIIDTSCKECPVLQKLIVYDEFQVPISLDCSLKVTPCSVWVSTKSKGFGMYVWNTETLEHKLVKLLDGVHISSMVIVKDNVWLGSTDGRVVVVSADTFETKRELSVHTDVVKSICVTNDGRVVTGSSSKEGKICVWNDKVD